MRTARRHDRPRARLALALALSLGASAASAVPFAGATFNSLVFFDSDAPGTVVATLPITGLQAGENIVGIDRRPANGSLYALTSASRLYVISTQTGVATQVGSGTFDLPLSGTSFGFDFNPAVDRIRVVSDTGQNLRLNPDTGQVVDADAGTAGTQPDGALNGAVSGATAAGYTNNVAATPSTTLIVLNATTDRAYVVNPPNAGTTTDTVTGAALGIDITPGASFEITAGGVGYILTGTTLYRVPVTSPAANTVTLGAPVAVGPASASIVGISEVAGFPVTGGGGVVPVPTLRTTGLFALALVLGLFAYAAIRRQRSEWPTSS